MLRKENLKDILPLTPMQSGILFHTMRSDPTTYIVQFSFRMHADLDPVLFRRSWNDLLQRHDNLRSLFVTKNVPEPLQIWLKSAEVDFSSEDIRHLQSQDRESYLDRYKREDRSRAFDLSRDSLMRVSLFRTDRDAYDVVWTFHHIIMDGWSVGIVLEELFALYQARLERREPDFPPPPSYRTYVHWLKNQDQEKARGFWKNYLRGHESAAHAAPIIKPHDQSAGYSPGRLLMKLDPDASARLTRLAVRYQVTLNTLIQFAWGLLLSRYNDIDDVVFGLVVSGRPESILDIDRMVGLLINTVPARLRIDPDQPIASALSQMQQEAFDAQDFHFYPLPDIQAEWSERRSGSQLIDHLIAFENSPLDDRLNRSVITLSSGLTLDRVESFLHTNYNFEMVILPGETIRFDFRWNKAVYYQDQIERMGDHLKTLLQWFVDHPKEKVGNAAILTQSEQRDIAGFQEKSNRTYRKNVIDLFEEQVDLTPDRLALIVCAQPQDRRISYRQLGLLVDRIALDLSESVSNHGLIIGVIADSSEFMIAGLLAILKIRCAYLPIDPKYPASRIDYMIRDSRCAFILAQNEYIPLTLNCLADQGVPKSKPIADIPWQLVRTGYLPWDIPQSDSDLAYVIYTSGSTGDPKGCMVDNRNLVRLFKNDAFPFDFDSSQKNNKKDVWIFAHSFCFDFSVWEMYGALLFGGTLVVPKREDVRDTSRFLQILSRYRVTILNQTPTAFYNLIAFMSDSPDFDQGLDNRKLDAIRHVIFGGEKLNPSHLRRWIECYPLDQCQLTNMYGITETTVHVTYYRLTERDIFGSTDSTIGSPIGRPLPETTVYVCDRRMNLTPPTIPGEFYVGGGGVCRGYLNRPDLTAERFVPNPFSSGRDRLYRTGDVGFQLPNRDLIYLDRNDNQVQVRGFRVELGEIESRLLEYRSDSVQIKEAAVIAREIDEDMQIIAYVATGKSGDLSISSLKENLRRSLPDYMIPARFVLLEKLPITANGKIDAANLPDPDISLKKVEPETERESDDLTRSLISIWRDALGLNRVGITDNFFDLGGHSLKATRLLSRVHKELSVELRLADIFQAPSVQELAALIRSRTSPQIARITRIPSAESDKGYYPLSHAQKSLWLAEQMEPNSRLFHVYGALRLTGEPDVDLLERAFVDMINRHESLRTGFTTIDSQPYQWIERSDSTSGTGFKIDLRDLSNLPAGQQEEEIVDRSIFDMSRPPLLRARLSRIAKNQYALGMNMHHIISDGWSVHVLIRELFTRYRAYQSGKSDRARLSDLPIHYKDYAAWHNRLLSGESGLRLRDYWLNRMQNRPDSLKIRTDFSRPRIKTYNGEVETLEIGDALKRRLDHVAKSLNATLYMVLTASLISWLHRYTAQNQIMIGAALACRNHPDLEEQIGFYINMLPLVVEVEAGDSFTAVAERVRSGIMEMYDHQYYPFDMLVQELQIPRNMSRLPLFDIAVDIQESLSLDLGLQNLTIAERQDRAKASKYDLTFLFSNETRAGSDDSKLRLYLEYNTDLFKPATIRRMLDQLYALTSEASQQPDIAVRDIALGNMELSEPKDRISTGFQF